ncbi:FK506-binding protein-like isoform X1 [Cylas formicarius]|uniref:FK506-binding protein-like isoform X1 n=1 Tax=Cylas formicarius TaxID=197179 RepID=UPI002958B2F0|nr:FK506-binding protein-like isoform X1 [Cylas formicarius]
MEFWTSPDGKISKKILVPGKWGNKPTENSKCEIQIESSSAELEKYCNSSFVIGDTGNDMERLLEICISTLHLHERSYFTIDLSGQNKICFNMHLTKLEFDSYIYEWNAKKKYNLAMVHKKKGKDFFVKQNYVEAAFKFVKGLKIISSVPIDIQNPPTIVDGVTVSDIRELKMKLYNNLSSCYFKRQCYEIVINLCNKVLNFDDNNVKALYKLGVAYENDKNFEKADEMLTKVLDIEPQNKACAEHLANVKQNLRNAQHRMNDIMRKMISETITK